MIFFSEACDHWANAFSKPHKTKGNKARRTDKGLEYLGEGGRERKVPCRTLGDQGKATWRGTLASPHL